jgi:hypothetical protein
VEVQTESARHPTKMDLEEENVESDRKILRGFPIPQLSCRQKKRSQKSSTGVDFQNGMLNQGATVYHTEGYFH